MGRAEGHDNDGLNNTIVGLIEQDPASAAPVVAEMLTSANVEDCADAAAFWGWLESVAPPGPLLVAATDPSSKVRANALGSLASYKDRDDVFRALLSGLADDQPAVRVSAASALGYYGNVGALSAIDALADDADANVRRFVSYAGNKLRAILPHA